MFHDAGCPARAQPLESRPFIAPACIPPAGASRVPPELPVEKDLEILLAHLGRLVLLALIMATPVALLYADIHWLGTGVGEWSLVELTQIGFLVTIVLAFVRVARARPDERGFAVLAAGFFACMLIRELDAVWDLVFHGLWSTMVTIVAASCLGYALRPSMRRATLSSTARFLASRGGALMSIALVLLLVYSRLFGMSSLWQGLLADGYVRVFKNAAEECTELLGYTLVMGAALAYAAQRLRERRKALAGGRDHAPSVSGNTQHAGQGH